MGRCGMSFERSAGRWAAMMFAFVSLAFGRTRLLCWAWLKWYGCSASAAGAGVALEALAAGIPVVARRRPDLLELVGDGETGHLVPKAEAHETARATRRLLDDADEARRFGEAARKHAAEFAVERIVPRWSALYSRLCRQH